MRYVKLQFYIYYLSGMKKYASASRDENVQCSFDLKLPQRHTNEEIAKAIVLTTALSCVSFNEELDQILWRDGGEVFSVRTCYS